LAGAREALLVLPTASPLEEKRTRCLLPNRFVREFQLETQLTTRWWPGELLTPRHQLLYRYRSSQKFLVYFTLRTGVCIYYQPQLLDPGRT